MKKIVTMALILLIVGILGSAVTAAVTGTFSLKTSSLHEEYEVNVSDINNIVVDVSSTDVKLLPADGDVIKVVLDGVVSERVTDEYKFVVEEIGDTFTVKMDIDLFFSIGVTKVDLDINVYLPEQVYDTINLQSSSGDLVVERLQSAELFLESSSGEITISDAKADTTRLLSSSGDMLLTDTISTVVEAEASSGDITFKDVEGNIDVATSSGEVTLNNQVIYGDFVVETSSGDVSVQYIEVPTSLSVDFKASSGDADINLDGISYEEKSENLVLGKIGNGEHLLKVRASSGDFELN